MFLRLLRFNECFFFFFSGGWVSFQCLGLALHGDGAFVFGKKSKNSTTCGFTEQTKYTNNTVVPNPKKKIPHPDGVPLLEFLKYIKTAAKVDTLWVYRFTLI